jgi:short-subunit dehydrogenase
LLARRPDALESQQRELTHSFGGTKVIAEPVDMCHRRSVEEAADRIEAALGTVDLLVQSVGMSDRGTLHQLECDRLHELLDVNVVSSLNAIQAFTPSLTRPGGTLVLIGSLASVFAPRFLGGYSITKHALAGLAQQARLELAAEGLQVLLACPGPIARADAGHRYTTAKQAAELPEAALGPGGGAKIRGLAPNRLARDILAAAAANKRVIIRPRMARLLLVLSAISPGLGDYLLQRKSS